MSHRPRTVVVALSLALACASPVLAAEKSSYLLPPPSATDVATGMDHYRIGPLDKLDVTVFQVKDLTGTVDVDATGQVQLPLVGTVQASGRTPSEVAKDIGDRLRESYIKDPQVTVTVREAVSQAATVGGAVTKPGVYPIPGHTTLSTAVALAGGADPQRANERRVRLIRMVNGQRVQATYNLAEIQRGSATDPEVFGKDTIIVEASGGRGFLHDLTNASPLFYLLHFL